MVKKWLCAIFVSLLPFFIITMPCHAALQNQLPADGKVVTNAAGNQQNFQVIADTSGGAILVWEDSRNGNIDIFAQRVDKDGNRLWSTSDVAVVTDTNTQDSLSISPDGSGGVIVAWSDSRTNSLTVTDIFAQRISAGGVVQWAANGVIVCTNSASQIQPAVASDGSGGAFVAWTDFRNGSANSEIFIQKISSASGSAQFSVGGTSITTAANNQSKPRMVSDDMGGVFVAWEDERTLTVDLFGQKVSSAGASQYGDNGLAISIDAVGAQKNHAVAIDGLSGVFVVWEDNRAGLTNNDIYAQHISSTGAVSLAANGLAICVALNDQLSISLDPDEVNRIYITWQDGRNGVSGGTDIYVQRLSTAGAIDFAVSGATITSDSTSQTAPSMAAGALGAVVSWTQPDLSDDIFARAISSGAPILDPLSSSLQVIGKTANQNASRVLQSSGSGFLVFWQDSRDGNVDIYMNRVATTTSSAGSGTGGEGEKITGTLKPIGNLFDPTKGESTTIAYNLSQDASVKISIYTLSGELVKTLVDESRSAGDSATSWDGRNLSGVVVASGIYLVNLSAGGFSVTKKIAILK